MPGDEPKAYDLFLGNHRRDHDVVEPLARALAGPWLRWSALRGAGNRPWSGPVCCRACTRVHAAGQGCESRIARAREGLGQGLVGSAEGSASFPAEGSRQELVTLFPQVNRRSLQRETKAMVDVGLLVSQGATNKLVYRLKKTS